MMAIPKDAKNVDNAYKLIDYLLQPKVMAGISSYVSYGNAVTESLPEVEASVRDNPGVYPPEDVRRKLFPLEVLTPEVSRQYTDMWSAMKSGS